MQRSVHGDFAEVKLDDLVERGRCFGVELVEDPGIDPFVAPSPQRGVGDLVAQDGFDVDPRRAGHEPDQDPPEAQLV